MREIKFRAWDEGNKVMHHEFQFIKSGEEGHDWIVFTSDKQTLKEKPHHPLENPYFQQQFKIMQFTGLRDRFGTEIYEGDVVKFLGYEVRLGKQIRPERRFVVDGNDWIASLIRTSSVVECNGSAEVIGNLYENPELVNSDRHSIDWSEDMDAIADECGL